MRADESSGKAGARSGPVTTAAHDVEVIVPIHDALEHVKSCVASLLRHWREGTRLRLVNDGSGTDCSQWLRELAARDSRVNLLELTDNVGYTRAINTALRDSNAARVVLLNSDTIVTRGWLDGLLKCAESSPTVGVVGPLSNAASWQSIPKVKEAGRFATNPLPEGLDAEAVAEIVRRSSARAYPRTPVINGFCFLITRPLLEAIGLFDEATFPQGYGEENDYCVRAALAGYELAIADDVFVYHAKSRSFGAERRDALARAGSEALKRKHGADTVERLSRGAQNLPALAAVRRAVASAYEQHQRKRVGRDALSSRVLFLLPVHSVGGGTHSVVQEVMAMRRLGVSASIAVLPEARAMFCKVYRDIGDIDDALESFTPEGLPELARRHDVVVATVYSSVELLERVRAAYPEVLCAYYVQDYEPLFFEHGSERWHAARASYTRIPGALLFAKTAWIADRVRQEHGVSVQKVVPSLDHEVYHPAPVAQGGVVRLVAMVRPQTPRRGAARTMRVLRSLARAHGDRVAIDVFGCDSRKRSFRELPSDFPFRNHGVLDRVQVAELLRAAHVFLDLSDYQAFGRTGLEAMASGCAVVLPVAGGAHEYAEDGRNALLVDTADEAECERRIAALISDPALMRQLRLEGLKTAAAYTTHRAALSELELFAKAAAAHLEQTPRRSRRQALLAPAFVSSDRASFSSHARLLHGWGSAALQRTWASRVVTALPEPGSADVLLLAADSALAAPATLAEWLPEWRRAGGKLVLELAAQGERPSFWLDARAGGHDAQLRWLARTADAVVVPSEELRARFSAENAEIFLVPSYLDAATWTSPVAEAAGSASQRDRPDIPRIGFIGSSAEWPHLGPVWAALQQLQSEGRMLELEVVGAGRGRLPAGRRVTPPPRLDFSEHARWLRTALAWEIAVLPVVDSAPSQDAGQKWLQYAALGLATVATRTPELCDLVNDGQTGLLVENDGSDWYRALRQLLDDAPLRRALAERASATLVSRFTVEANQELYASVLDRVVALPHRQDRVAPPQSWPALGSRKLSAATREIFTFEALRRKQRKLRQDPAAFFADSRSAVVRGLGKVIVRR